MRDYSRCEYWPYTTLTIRSRILRKLSICSPPGWRGWTTDTPKAQHIVQSITMSYTTAMIAGPLEFVMDCTMSYAWLSDRMIAMVDQAQHIVMDCTHSFTRSTIAS